MVKISDQRKGQPIKPEQITNQKTQFHDNFARIKPVKVGPTAGANIITSEQTPIAVPIFCGGKMFIATVNINGKIVPVPIP